MPGFMMVIEMLEKNLTLFLNCDLYFKTELISDFFLGLLTMPTMVFQHQPQVMVFWEMKALLVILKHANLWQQKLLLYLTETV
jgi:hypothetical protein